MQEPTFLLYETKIENNEQIEQPPIEQVGNETTRICCGEMPTPLKDDEPSREDLDYTH